MEPITITEIVTTGLSLVLPALAGSTPIVGAIFGSKSGAAKSIVAHVSCARWVKRMRKAGFSEKKIRKMIEEAAHNDLSR